MPFAHESTVRVVVVALLTIGAFSAQAAPATEGDAHPLGTDGFIRDWLVLEPSVYQPAWPPGIETLDGQPLANERALRPKAEKPAILKGSKLIWKAATAEKGSFDITHDGVLINGVTWAAAYVEALSELRNVTLDLGANDHAKILVNDKEVAREISTGGLDRPHKKVRITLRKGRNLIALKSLNSAGKWQAQVGFFDDKGQPLTGLKVYLAPPEPDFSAGR